MVKRVYKVGTTAGNRWSIGNFMKTEHGEEMQAMSYPKYFKTEQDAKKYLDKLLK